jgi:hypothetical protein
MNLAQVEWFSGWEEDQREVVDPNFPIGRTGEEHVNGSLTNHGYEIIFFATLP